MRRVAKRVGDAIAAEMGDVFGLMFDGWASDTVHFVAILAVYHVGDGRRERLIGLSPIEFGQSADTHIEHISPILNVYNKDMSMVKFLVGDNCATNRSVATKLGDSARGVRKPSVQSGCGQVLSDSEDLVSQVQNDKPQQRHGARTVHPSSRCAR